MDARPLLDQFPLPPEASRSPPSKPPPGYQPPTMPSLTEADQTPAPSARAAAVGSDPSVTAFSTVQAAASASARAVRDPAPASSRTSTTTKTSSPETKEKHEGIGAIRQRNVDEDEENEEGATNEHATASSTTSGPASGSSPNSIRDVESGFTRSRGGLPPSSESSDHDKGGLHRFLDLVRRRKNQALPVRNPPRGTFKRWIEIDKSNQIGFLPEGLVQIRIAVCGFAMYGIMTLFNNTWELIKNFSDNGKVVVMLFIGLFWALASFAVSFTLSGRTRTGHLLSQHGTRLCLLGITLLLLFNISLMLPQGFWRENGASINYGSAVATILLPLLAIIGLALSWIPSMFLDEADRKLA